MITSHRPMSVSASVIKFSIEPDSRLANALGAAHEVNSMHHQGIGQLGAALRVVAQAEDGLPEALEVPILPYFCWRPVASRRIGHN